MYVKESPSMSEGYRGGEAAPQKEHLTAQVELIFASFEAEHIQPARLAVSTDLHLSPLKLCHARLAVM